MEIVINAFSNRLDLEYLKNKMEVYLKTNKSNIRRDLRMAEDHRNRAKFLNDLARYFSEDILYALYAELMGTFLDDAKAVYVMMGFLAKVMNTEKKSSRDVWAKVFILNLADIYNNIFDIEPELAEGEDSYIDKIDDVFYSMITDFLSKQKDIKVSNNKIHFGVRTPKSKKKELIESYDAVPVSTDTTDNKQLTIEYEGKTVIVDNNESSLCN